jgi:hypothetical protein
LSRKNINTTLDTDLYNKLKLLAVVMNVNANDLIEEGMNYVYLKYKHNLNNISESGGK